MKVVQFKVPRLLEETIRVEYWEMPYFYDPIHFHEECQLTYVIEGEGSLYVGSSISNFKAGDLFLLGKNLPHVLRCDEKYHTDGSKLYARAVTVFFSIDVFASLFVSIPESYALEKLLSYANYGIRVEGPVVAELSREMKSLLELSGFDRVIAFFTILNKISKCQSLYFISSGSVPIHSVTQEEAEIHKVYKYILANFREKITLADVSAIVHLTPSAFCRFFKSRTQKTFSRFLIEVRIGNICKMLSEGKYNSTECAYLSGYNNISNFHRHFKIITGMTTSDYRKTLRKYNVSQS